MVLLQTLISFRLYILYGNDYYLIWLKYFSIKKVLIVRRQCFSHLSNNNTEEDFIDSFPSLLT